MTAPLDGVKILEFGEFISAPFCAKLLADLGAEVIKIEEPGVGDCARRREPLLNDVPHRERSGLFLYLNTNKLGVTLDVQTTTGQKLFKQLVGQVDILIEDKPPRTIKDLGLEYERLKSVNPRLIMTSITPFGQSGPYRDFKAVDLNIYHGGGDGYLLPSGLAFALYPDRPPLRGAWYLADYQAGVTAAVGTLGALFAKAQYGVGQHVDVSKQEVQLNINRADIGDYLENGKVPHRVVRGTRRAFAFGGCMQCKDGYVEILALDEKAWQCLVKLMDEPEWTKDERFKDIYSRPEHGEELNRLMGQWMMQHTRDEIQQRGLEMGCTLGGYYAPRDVVNSEHERARAFFVDVDHPEAGKLSHPSWPYKFSKTPARIEMAAPLLGQHNEDIYSSRLGYGKQDLRKMAEAGII